MEDIRSIKANKFKELQNKRGSVEYEEYFLRYTPGDINGKQKTKKQNEKKKKTGKRSKRTARKKTRKKSRFSKFKKNLGL
jgi:hypothetical protein